MHKHKRVRHGHRMHGTWKPFGGFFWVLLLAFFFLGDGRWWPGILILVGLSIMFGSMFRDEAPQPPQDLPPVQTPKVPVAPTMTVTTAAVEPAHRADLLPAACPQCGGPVRVPEVRWTAKQSAACAYCGSDLMMAK